MLYNHWEVFNKCLIRLEAITRLRYFEVKAALALSCPTIFKVVHA